VIVRKLLLYSLQNLQVAVVFLLGLTLALVGALFWTRDPIVSTTLISIGSSLIAASLVTYLSPANREIYQKFLKLGISDVYLPRSDVPKKKWVEWLRSARHHCVLFGISNNQWCRDEGFPPALLELVQRDVTVQIFFLDPTSHVARQRTREESASARDTVQTIKESVKFVWDLKQRMELGLRGNLKLYVYNATPSFGATWVDTLMIATHYLAGFANVTSPAVIIKPVHDPGENRDLYGIYAVNIRNVENHYATEIKEENVANYTPTDPNTD
jgi:hypothetical protein